MNIDGSRVVYHQYRTAAARMYGSIAIIFFIFTIDLGIRTRQHIARKIGAGFVLGGSILLLCVLSMMFRPLHISLEEVFPVMVVWFAIGAVGSIFLLLSKKDKTLKGKADWKEDILDAD